MRRHASLLLIAFAGACASGSSSGAPAPGAAPSANVAPAAVGRTYMVNVTSTGMTSSRMTGTITLVPRDASTFSVTMELAGGPKSAQMPWAIRPGACGDVTPNSEIGNRSAYGPIATQADGSAHVNTRLHIALPAQQLHLDIMQSPRQRDVVIACGPLLAR